MQTELTFWQSFIGVVIKPLSTFQRLREDERAALKGWMGIALGVVLVIIYGVPIGLFIR